MVMKNKKPLKDQLALVTGASRGIGRAVALALARNGAHVDRRRAHHRRAGGARRRDPQGRRQGDAAAVDLSKGDKIDQLGPTLFQRWGKLDIFVGNAGILGPLSPLHHVTEDAWNSVIDINLSANWRLIRTLDPLLKRSEAGRAVFVTSAASSGKYAYWGPYAVSKAGLEALVKTYAHELADTPVRVNLVNPGADAHGDARQGLSGRGSEDAAGTGRVGADVPGARLAGLRSQRTRHQFPRLEEEARADRRLNELSRTR